MANKEIITDLKIISRNREIAELELVELTRIYSDPGSDDYLDSLKEDLEQLKDVKRGLFSKS